MTLDASINVRGAYPCLPEAAIQERPIPPRSQEGLWVVDRPSDLCALTHATLILA